MRHYQSAGSAQTTNNWFVTSEDKHIKKLLIWVNEAAKESSYILSNYQRLKSTLISLSVRINSEYLPKEPLEFVLTSRDAIRPYNEFLNSHEKSLLTSFSKEPVLDFNEWCNDQNIYSVSIPSSYTVYDNKNSDIHIRATYSAAPTSAVIHCCIVTEN